MDEMVDDRIYEKDQGEEVASPRWNRKERKEMKSLPTHKGLVGMDEMVDDRFDEKYPGEEVAKPPGGRRPRHKKRGGKSDGRF